MTGKLKPGASTTVCRSHIARHRAEVLAATDGSAGADVPIAGGVCDSSPYVRGDPEPTRGNVGGIGTTELKGGLGIKRRRPGGGAGAWWASTLTAVVRAVRSSSSCTQFARERMATFLKSNSSARMLLVW